LKNAEWDEESLKLLSVAFEKTIFNTIKCPKGLILHICDFYIEEIAKVADGELSEEQSNSLIEPFLVYYTKLNDEILLKHVRTTVVDQLLYQSELGQNYQEKFNIWKQANFPTKYINDLEINYQVRGNKSFDDDDQSDGEDGDENERPLDPRAGRVNVVLTEIKFDALKLAEMCENLRYDQFATGKSRKGLATMASNFRKFANEIFPLGIHRVPQKYIEGDSKIDLDLKAMELAEFQKKLAIGDVDSESSDFDEDLDNRKHGTLKRKNKDTSTKIVKEKKQKLSKLHNERFFKAAEDFTKDNSQRDEEEEEPAAEQQQTEMKIKKKKKKSIKAAAESNEELPRKIKLQKRKSLQAQLKSDDNDVSEKKSRKASKVSSEPTHDDMDDSTEPLIRHNAEMFTSTLVLNPFAKKSGKGAIETTPRIQQDKEKKRVKICINRNKAQSPHEYIKQVKESPNLPTAYLSKKPMKSVLKPNTLPSPINPFYKDKIGFKLNMNDTI
jgi:ribosomal RNA-processing protein 1